MNKPPKIAPQSRMQPVKRDLMRALTVYLAMVFILQCLWALPPGLHELRHTHAPTGASMRAMPSLATTRAAQPHAHGNEVHQHDSTTTDVVVLGEAGDESTPASALALWATLWPSALPFKPALAREAFARAQAVSFSSHGTRVPLQPPQRG